MTFPKRLLVLLGGSALFYGLLWSRCPVGWVLDDSMYLIGAKSLVQGSYRNFVLPGNPPIAAPPPGYSFFLAPFAHLAHPPFEALKLTSFLLLLGCGVLSWVWARRRLGDVGGLAVAALFLVNPVVAKTATVLVAEPLFLFLILASVLQFERVMRRGDGLAFLIALAMASVLVRPQGILWAAALAGALFYARDRQAGLRLAFYSVATWLAWQLRNKVLAPQAGGYGSLWGTMADSFSAGPGFWVGHGWDVVQTMVGQVLVAWPAGHVVATGFLIAATVLMLAAVGYGLRLLAQSSAEERLQLFAPACFLLLYTGLHVVWLALDERYFLPLLPFLLLPLVATLLSLRPWGRMVILFLSLWYAASNLVAAPLLGGAKLALPVQTYRWIQEHVPSDSLLFTPAAATGGLYTQRKMVYAQQPEDADALRFELLTHGITHLLYQSSHLITVSQGAPQSVDGNRQWARTGRWLVGDSKHYAKLYENEKEGTVLFAINPDPAFVKAYHEFRQIVVRAASSPPADTAKELRAILKEVPDFPSAWNALASTYLRSGNEVVAADQAAQQALRLRPHYPFALLNRARVQARKGQSEAARALYQQALDVIARTDETPFLVPLIQEEMP